MALVLHLFWNLQSPTGLKYATTVAAICPNLCKIVTTCTTLMQATARLWCIMPHTCNGCVIRLLLRACEWRHAQRFRTDNACAARLFPILCDHACVRQRVNTTVTFAYHLACVSALKHARHITTCTCCVLAAAARCGHLTQHS